MVQCTAKWEDSVVEYLRERRDRTPLYIQGVNLRIRPNETSAVATTHSEIQQKMNQEYNDR